MKKIVALVVMLALLAMTLCACKVGECDICGESGFLTERTVLGTDLYICSDCND